MGGREALQALLQRGAGDVERVDRVRLAALTSAPARAGSGASGSAAPARRARSETAPATPRRGGSPRAPRPARHRRCTPTAAARRTRAGRPRPFAGRAARRFQPRSPRSCANACACPRRARSSPRPPRPQHRRTPGGHGLLEAVPRIYQVTPDIPDRRRATQHKQVRPSPADSPKESQLAAGRDHHLHVGRHRRPQSKQQASLRQRGCAAAALAPRCS